VLLFGELSAEVRAQGVWAAGFDHQATGPQVHPLSDSLSPTLAQFWITQNFSPTDPNAPPAPQSGMNTVHVSLIPSGVHRGEVLVLDGNLTNHGTRAYQPWSIVNPYWPAPNPNYWTPLPGPPPPQYRFHNGLIPMPAGEGELFCAGHCWLPDGRLLLAGGTKRYPIQTQGLWEGGRLIYQWDHVVTLPGYPFGRWHRMPSNLEAFRWYPTVRVDGTRDWRAIVIGGFHWTAGSAVEEQQVNSYESVRWAAFNAPAIPALLAPPTAWAELAPHAGPRDYHSTALLLPDGRVVVAGGESRKNGAFPGPDYLIYEPPYFSLDYGSVPPVGIVVTNAQTNQQVQQDAIGPQGMQYGTDYRATWTNTLEDGITVAGVVLVAPSSVTHHDDGGQRVVRLSIRYDDDQTDQPANAIKFRSPANERVAPPGWWMLFLVTTSARPSQAYWVHLL
jgi:hypothetical protein